MKKIVTILLATLLTTLVGCASQSVAFMRGADIATADQAPDAKKYLGGKPGGQDKVARTYRDQPPVIPHAVENFDEITLDENPCLNCHITDEFKGAKMPKMGVSHFSTTAKKADGTPLVNMVRWQCNSCHVQQADAQPLVENTFVGHIVK